jgi:hypothetical protein
MMTKQWRGRATGRAVERLDAAANLLWIWDQDQVTLRVGGLVDWGRVEAALAGRGVRLGRHPDKPGVVTLTREVLGGPRRRPALATATRCNRTSRAPPAVHPRVAGRHGRGAGPS